MGLRFSEKRTSRTTISHQQSVFRQYILRHLHHDFALFVPSKVSCKVQIRQPTRQIVVVSRKVFKCCDIPSALYGFAFPARTFVEPELHFRPFREIALDRGHCPDVLPRIRCMDLVIHAIQSLYLDSRYQVPLTFLIKFNYLYNNINDCLTTKVRGLNVLPCATSPCYSNWFGRFAIHDVLHLIPDRCLFAHLAQGPLELLFELETLVRRQANAFGCRSESPISDGFTFLIYV